VLPNKDPKDLTGSRESSLLIHAPSMNLAFS